MLLITKKSETRPSVTKVLQKNDQLIENENLQKLCYEMDH